MFTVYVGNFEKYVEGRRIVYTSLWVAECIVLLVFTLWMVAYVLLVKQQVKQAVEQSQKEGEGSAYQGLTTRSMWRINTVVAACTIAALLRLAALCFIIAVSFEFNELQWFIYSNWIPTVIPSIVLLFVTRPNPNVDEEGGDNGESGAGYSTDETHTSVTTGQTDPARFGEYDSTDDSRKSRFSSFDGIRRSRFSSSADHTGNSGDAVSSKIR
jgi:hypothetical protein